MLGFTKRLTTAVARNLVMRKSLALQVPIFYFCNNNNGINPVLAKIKEAYVTKGHKSVEYQQEMSKAMRDALSKYDHDAAINLELFHLSLIKESQGEKSETYTSELRQIAKFCINRLHFDTAAKLIEELRRIEQTIQGISPLDLVSTYYLQGYVYMELEKYQESKQCFNKCLEMKHVKDAPQVFFKVYSEMARVHARCRESEEAYKKLAMCEQTLKNRNYDANAPPMIMVMDLQDVFHLAEISSSMNDKASADKYLNMYKEKLDKVSNSKDPMYVEYLERKAKIHFNLKQFKEAVQRLRQAAGMSQELSKVDPNFKQNVNIMNGIAQSIEKEYLKK